MSQHGGGENSPGAEGQIRGEDFCTEEKSPSRQARGDILLLCRCAWGFPCVIVESRLTDAYAMHFVSRRALLVTVGWG